MKGGKLFQLLLNLQREEWKDLKKMVCSPIYNTNKTLEILLVELKKQYPDFDTSQKGKELLFKKIWPGRNFDNYKIHRLYTQLTQLVEEYLLLLDQRQHSVERKKRLMTIYRKRNLLPFFEKEVKGLTKEFHDFPFRDLEYYRDQIQLNEAIYFHPSYNKYDLKDESLDQLINSLDYYFVLAKMRYGLSLKNRERILTKPGSWRFINAIHKEKGLDFIRNTSVYQLYQKAFLLLDEEQEIHFKEYEKLLFENITILGIDRKILFYNGLNYITRQVNKGLSKYSQKALQWYQFGLHNGLLIDHGKMSEVTFGNIVTFGCRQKEFAWTRDFINAYQHLLEENKRKDIETYHLGLWYFYQQDFEAAFSILLNYSFIPAYYLKSRATAIRALFEEYLINRDSYELVMAHSNAVEMAVRRSNAFSKNMKEPVYNFLRIIKSLTRKIQDHKIDAQLINHYREILNTNKKIATRQWLIAKLDQLSK